MSATSRVRTSAESLAKWVVDAFPDLNVLVNNAGIQRRFRLADPESWEMTHHEIAINLDAPFHLGMLLLPHLRERQSAAIVNVTSGLAYVPFVAAPVYSATKAALHSYTLSLRHHLADTGVSSRSAMAAPSSDGTRRRPCSTSGSSA